jgi:hypothetical protein
MMEPRIIQNITTVLSPEEEGHGVPADLDELPAVVLEFTLVEVTTKMGCFRSRGKAPGSDGIPSRV